MAATTPDPAARDALARRGPVFAALVGLTALAILLQAVFAGEFVDRAASSGWLDAHSVNGDVAAALSLVSAVYALVTLRAVARQLVIGSAVLAVAMIAQSAIGHSITSDGNDDLIVVHIPLALAVFGLTIWLSVKARALRITAAAARGTR